MCVRKLLDNLWFVSEFHKSFLPLFSCLKWTECIFQKVYLYKLFLFCLLLCDQLPLDLTIRHIFSQRNFLAATSSLCKSQNRKIFWLTFFCWIEVKNNFQHKLTFKVLNCLFKLFESYPCYYRKFHTET